MRLIKSAFLNASILSAAAKHALSKYEPIHELYLRIGAAHSYEPNISFSQLLWFL